MSLPVRTTAEDVVTIVDYLKNKAVGATITVAKTVINAQILDSRKLKAYVDWNLVEREGDTLQLSTLGREISRAEPAERRAVFRKILRDYNPYHPTLEWLFHQKSQSVTNVEVGAHWHQHYSTQLETRNERIIKEMVACFFQVCDAAGLGTFVYGRRGQPTRFEIDTDELELFITQKPPKDKGKQKETITNQLDEQPPSSGKEEKPDEPPTPSEQPVTGKPERLHVFVSHSKNMEIVEQIKTMVGLADLEYEVVVEHETTAIPVPDKVFDAMRRCNAAIICVTADENQKSEEKKYTVNENVLIEIGAAFVLYEKRVVLVWDKRVNVPSNLQGLYRCEYSGEELSWNAGMKLMKAVRNFKIE